MAEVAQQTELLATCLTDIIIVPGSPTEGAGFVAPVIQDRSVLCTAKTTSLLTTPINPENYGLMKCFDKEKCMFFLTLGLIQSISFPHRSHLMLGISRSNKIQYCCLRFAISVVISSLKTTPESFDIKECALSNVGSE